jgi:hypothetical protein
MLEETFKCVFDHSLFTSNPTLVESRKVPSGKSAPFQSQSTHTRSSNPPAIMSSSQATIVFFASVAGAAAFTALGSSIHSRFFPPEVKQTVQSDWSQAQYMREVRLRYAEAMAHSNGYGRRW